MRSAEVLARVAAALDNEQRYHDALQDAGSKIVDVAGRMQSALISADDASMELLSVARSILVALRLEDEPDAEC